MVMHSRSPQPALLWPLSTLDARCSLLAAGCSPLDRRIGPPPEKRHEKATRSATRRAEGLAFRSWRKEERQGLALLPHSCLLALLGHFFPPLPFSPSPLLPASPLLPFPLLPASSLQPPASRLASMPHCPVLGREWSFCGSWRSARILARLSIGPASPGESGSPREAGRF